jgi:hypothetical protein
MNLMVEVLLALSTLSAIEMDLLRSRVEARDGNRPRPRRTGGHR